MVEGPETVKTAHQRTVQLDTYLYYICIHTFYIQSYEQPRVRYYYDGLPVFVVAVFCKSMSHVSAHIYRQQIVIKT